MNVTFYGQSSLTAEPAGTRLLFDPFIQRDDLAKNAGIHAIRADDIRFTHGHFDRVADASDFAHRPGVPVIGPALGWKN